MSAIGILQLSINVAVQSFQTSASTVVATRECDAGTSVARQEAEEGERRPSRHVQADWPNLSLTPRGTDTIKHDRLIPMLRI